MIDKIIGRNPNCYTGGDCWNYDYSDRWSLLFGITLGIVGICLMVKKYKNKDIIDS